MLRDLFGFPLASNVAAKDGHGDHPRIGTGQARWNESAAGVTTRIPVDPTLR